MKEPINVIVRDYTTVGGLKYIVFEKFYKGKDGQIKGRNLFKTNMEAFKNTNMTDSGLKLLALVLFYIEKPEEFDRDVTIYFDDEVVVENVREAFGVTGPFNVWDTLHISETYETLMRNFYAESLSEELVDAVDDALNVLRQRERRLSFEKVDIEILKALDLVIDE